MLENVSPVGEALLVGDKRFADVGEGVLAFAGVDVLVEDAVAGEDAEEALEVLGVAGGEDAGEDLGGGDGGVGAGVPDGVGNVEANDGV